MKNYNLAFEKRNKKIPETIFTRNLIITPATTKITKIKNIKIFSLSQFLYSKHKNLTHIKIDKVEAKKHTEILINYWLHESSKKTQKYQN